MARPLNVTAEIAGKAAELLSVKIGDQDFAIDIMSVREIRGWITSTPLPHAPLHIKGMINLRGVVLAIVDLAERLGLPSREPDPSSVVVVVEAGARAVGLVVDGVSDVITISEDMIQPAPEIGSQTTSRCVEGLLTLEGRIVTIINIAAIMPTEFEFTPLAA